MLGVGVGCCGGLLWYSALNRVIPSKDMGNAV